MFSRLIEETGGDFGVGNRALRFFPEPPMTVSGDKTIDSVSENARNEFESVKPLPGGLELPHDFQCRIAFRLDPISLQQNDRSRDQFREPFLLDESFSGFRLRGGEEKSPLGVMTNHEEHPTCAQVADAVVENDLTAIVRRLSGHVGFDSPLYIDRSCGCCWRGLSNPTGILSEERWIAAFDYKEFSRRNNQSFPFFHFSIDWQKEGTSTPYSGAHPS